MATSIPRRCTATPTCPNPATRQGRCTDHQHQADQQRNTRRTASLAVYRSKRWRKLRRQVLNEEPYCQHPRCGAPATDVDHITRIEDGGSPWERTNLQALCHPHHSSKTARETGLGGGGAP